ncbi:Biotin carboxyl carrier protein of acetyl-CoA carboxylase [Enhygromyxa salina]|uniref:Biotin carboxyl carrier protein of acetyl-CoA carboxylase n=1 Tax=Enhygromyxa salina TaxID=215803 RepID=A0A0C1ZLA7_9BACT|nr:acetyl-CoA carboxylase biotin carboxyl carrier protein [Enhygromyxa salina]KIG18319.1 Biotin carboxyl carrier protein of acetyl-CoA carboxylase [Enhygromyxa salina]
MSDQDSKLPDIAYVSELAKLFKRFRLDELEIETGEQRILMRRGDLTTTAQLPMPAPMPVAAVAAPTPAANQAPTPAEVTDDSAYITSPFVGTFYTSPRPDAPLFVKVGDTVSAGTTVCIVEAMKLFNEIEAEFGCIIEEVLVGNQQPVEFGTKLFRVRRL